MYRIRKLLTPAKMLQIIWKERAANEKYPFDQLAFLSQNAGETRITKMLSKICQLIVNSLFQFGWKSFLEYTKNVKNVPKIWPFWNIFTTVSLWTCNLIIYRMYKLLHLRTFLVHLYLQKTTKNCKYFSQRFYPLTTVSTIFMVDTKIEFCVFSKSLNNQSFCIKFRWFVLLIVVNRLKTSVKREITGMVRKLELK